MSISALSVLLVEDDPVAAEMITSMLRASPGPTGSTFAVTHCSSLAETTELCAKHTYDAILLDLGLPDSSGSKTVSTMQGRFPHVPIVAITGDNAPGAGLETVRAGAQDYLVKGAFSADSLRCSIMYCQERFIIERKQRDLEAAYAHLFKRFSDGVAVCEGSDETSDFVCVDINAAGERICDVRRADIVGRTIIEAFPGYLVVGLVEILKRVKQTGISEKIPVRQHNTGRGIRWLEKEIYMLPSGSLVIVLRDLTEKRQAEIQNVKLAQKLIQVQKIEALGQLASGMAHDFNNRLSAISGYADLLCSRLTDQPKLAGYAQRIIDAAVRGGELNKKMLLYARKGVFSLESVSVNERINVVVDMLGHTIGKNITIRCNLQAKKCMVAGDSGQLEQMLLNLAVNARDAMQDGGVLTFSTAEVFLDKDYCVHQPYECTPGQYVRIAVSDTGCGIPRELQAKVFEPFFTTKQHEKGTGLGLASVYGCVKQHHGYVHLYSEVGHGTEFKVYLPAQAEKPSVPSGTAIIRPSRVPVAPRVTVVDDEESMRDICFEMLSSLGFVVTVFGDGKTALDWLCRPEANTDVVLLDMIMPGMSGKQLFAEMRQQGSTVPVIVMSGYSDQRDYQDMLDMGAARFIDKPFVPSQVSNVILEVLAESAGRQA